MHSTRPIINEKVWILFTLCIAVVIRMLFFFSTPTPITMPDTFGYNSVGYRIFQTSLPILNDERTPVYPILFTLSMNLAGRTENKLDIPSFYKGAQILAFFQSAVAVISLLMLYKILHLLRLPDKVRYAIGMLTAVDIMVFSWERFLLTESLAISWMIGAVYLALRTTKVKPRVTHYVYVALYLGLGFLLRPAFVGIGFALVFAGLFISKKTAIQYGSITALYLVFPAALIISNAMNFNYKGINHVTDIAALGRILKNSIPIESAKNNIFYPSVTSYRAQNSSYDPFDYLYYYDQTFLNRTDNKDKLNELKTFTGTVLKNHPFLYCGGLLRDFVPALLEAPSNSNPQYTIRYKPLWNFLYSLFKPVRFLQLLSLPLGILVFFIQWVKKRSYTEITVLLALCSYMLIASVTVYNDYGRILIPARIPLLLLFISSVRALKREFSSLKR